MAELKPVQRGDRWRIQMSWPGYNARFFGDFNSEAEATRWIKDHSWLPQTQRHQRCFLFLSPPARTDV
jgi:hypothetical protein